MSDQNKTENNLYRFDDLTVDCANFRVEKNGLRVTLIPRAFDVLAYLIQNAGRVVEKQELFEQVWKDNFVSDNALTKIIKEIRHALEDPADHPHYIETVPKRGYHFIGEIIEKPDQPALEIERRRTGQIVAGREDDPGEKSLRPAIHITSPRFVFSKTVLAVSLVGLISLAALVMWLLFRQKAAETSPIRSIAVLPFKPLDTDSRDESLEMGMAETLITRLSNLKQIVVRPMSAVRKYTDLQQDPVSAGQEQQAEVVLDGSIQKAGDRVRVTVRLINVQNGVNLWTERFDENSTDIFKLQDSITERVTNALTLQLSRQEKGQLAKHYTNSPEAYQLYLQGQYVWHRRQLNWNEQRLEFYRQALEKDPDFALAHIGIAECYIRFMAESKIPVEEAVPKVKASIMKALALDDNLAEAHNALAETKYQFEYDWTGAEKDFQKAIELNPNVAFIRLAYGWFLMSAGRFDEAKNEMEKARELDPGSLTINISRGRLFYFSRQYDQAIRHFQNIITVEPNSAISYFSLFAVYEQKQMYAEAVEASLKYHSLIGRPPEMIEENREAFRVSGWEGFLRKRLEAWKTIGKTEYVPPLFIADFYTRLGQKDEAFAWLEKAFDAGDPSIIRLKIEPLYDSLRDDPRYTELIRKIGLQP